MESKDLEALASSAEEKEPELDHLTASVSVSEPHTIFTFGQRCFICGMVCVAATFSSFAGNVYYPAIPSIAKDLSVTSELVNLTVTAYMIFQGMSPTFWGALSDTMGRRVTYISTFVVFICACIGLAETKHYYQLVILRCLQSTGSASTIAIGAGVIGDLTVRENRGGWMGVYQGFFLMPNAIGPVVGGLFSATLGWRWIFWFLTIFSGAFLALLILFLPETLRNLVGNGSLRARGPARSILGDWRRRQYLKQHPMPHLERTKSPMFVKRKIDFMAPLRIVFGGEVTCAILFLSCAYTLWQMVMAAMSTLIQRQYGLNDIDTGLTFLCNGFGCMIGTIITGKLLDIDYRKTKARYTGPPEDFPIEQTRLRTVWFYTGMQAASAVVFGWTLDKKVHLSVPLIAGFFLGWAATAIQSVVTTLLVDIFNKQSASATAALNLARCLVGAGGTAAILPIVNAIGAGWAFTLFAMVLVLALGLLVVQLRYGPKWRKRRQAKQTLKE
ncbi:putative multidrug transporter [Rhizodiscina lignyota]|uniref:Multidrug transporter n=1 Tax=Rhizodiscina lignyota TaxID=1504668 RepID=A0A9P4MAU2_9PEZI|nr:putative multidrug transporter [Rhizodiscina lignyota]